LARPARRCGNKDDKRKRPAFEEVGMTVASILAEKGRAVFTTSPETLLSQAIDQLAGKRVGAIVVIDKNGKVSGIVSERDIVRELSRKGIAVLDQPVSSCMTHKVLTCSESDTVDTVMTVMTTNRFRHLPVVSGGKLCGIISIGDVVKRKIEQAERDAEHLRNYIAMS
jgi:CBS domain-containing protein